MRIEYYKMRKEISKLKIDIERLRALCALGDDELWREVRGIAASYGLNLPERTPPHSEMDKMREAVSGGGGMSLRDAMRLINEYRRGNK